MTVVTASIQNAYFDRQRVIQQIGRENARRLGRMGSFIRRRAAYGVLRRAPKGRKGAKKRRVSAARGEPPKVHSRSKHASLRNIRYGLGADRESVVIGPLFVPSLRPRSSSAKTVPELLTKGGTARVSQHSYDGKKWQLGDLPQAPHRRSQAAKYHEHPFMTVALEKEVQAGTVTDVWSR